ncbi:MAG: dephospho-CoA kinase [Bacteroidia bacterium]|nr:dephospho-CoA kinase [Bacteroidia bacterium]
MTGPKWDKKIIGLAGGIGSGKSMIARLFQMLGSDVFNSDEAAHQAYFMEGIREKIVSLLGPEAYLNKGEINKPFIRKRIFEDSSVREALNAIIHPCVGKMFDAFTEKSDKKIIIKESALLFESGIYKKCSENILVTSPMELRMARLKKRDGLSEDEIRKRMEAQWPDEKKIPLADYVIRNDEKHSVIEQVWDIHRKISEN